MTSRLLKIIGLFRKRDLLKRWYSAKETYNFKEPTNRSLPISYTYRLTLRYSVIDMPCSYVWQDSFVSTSWLIHRCDMTRSYVWHDLSTHVTWLIRRELRKILGFLKVYQSVCAMCLIQTFDRIFSYVWLNACTCVTWLVHTCDMTHSQEIAQMSGSSRSVSQSVCGVPYPYVWHVSFVCYV